MKAVMVSVKPRHTANIMAGVKTLELRKARPDILVPFKVYVYETLDGGKGAGAVVCEFTCDKIYPTCGWRLKGNTGRVAPRKPWEETFPEQACLSLNEVLAYVGGNENRLVFGWHISELNVYDRPRPLGDFIPFCKFMVNDCECDHRKVACPHQEFDYNPWPDCSLNMVTCKKRMTRPPQSWCYVSEGGDGR